MLMALALTPALATVASAQMPVCRSLAADVLQIAFWEKQRAAVAGEWSIEADANRVLEAGLSARVCR